MIHKINAELKTLHLWFVKCLQCLSIKSHVMVSKINYQAQTLLYIMIFKINAKAHNLTLWKIRAHAQMVYKSILR